MRSDAAVVFSRPASGTGPGRRAGEAEGRRLQATIKLLNNENGFLMKAFINGTSEEINGAPTKRG